MSLILAGSISLDSNFKVKAVYSPRGRVQYSLFIPLQDREGTDFFPLPESQRLFIKREGNGYVYSLERKEGAGCLFSKAN
jgi:hypothetical protein